jgi:hypothetical protein
VARRRLNALRFATREEADSYGFDLLCRWTAPEDYEIREMEDAVNYRWGKAGAEEIEEAQS